MGVVAEEESKDLFKAMNAQITKDTLLRKYDVRLTQLL